MSDKDEYRFHPEDFDDDGNPPEPETDPAPLVIIACFGMGLGFLVASFFTGSFDILGVEIGLVSAATAMFAFGLVIGGGSYIRQGRLWLGAIHLGGALGWLLIILGTTYSHSIVVFAGTAILVMGGAALFVFLWRSGS